MSARAAGVVHPLPSSVSAYSASLSHSPHPTLQRSLTGENDDEIKASKVRHEAEVAAKAGAAAAEAPKEDQKAEGQQAAADGAAAAEPAEAAGAAAAAAKGEREEGQQKQEEAS